jgi:hypothetical protein
MSPAVLWLCLLTALATAQTAPSPVEPQSAAGLIRRVRIVDDRGPALEILYSGGRITPQFQTLNAPPRLIVDLPNTRLGPAAKRTAIQKDNIQAILAYQYQQRPPVTRIILDFIVAIGYTWENATDRLIVHLKPPSNLEASNPDPAASLENSLPAVASGSLPGRRPVAMPVTGGSGALVLAGSRLASGSSLTAGSETAVLRLARGGEVYVCPGTSVTVASSHNQRDLMMGLSLGGMEAHYSLPAAADSVLTPDFRILFSGPGHFDFAISADTHGNTCVRALPGNRSSAIVSELIGDRIYQVRPAEQAVFRGGRIDHIDAEIPPECGCPPPPAVMRPEPSGPPLPDSALPEKTQLSVTPAASPKTGELGTVIGATATTTLSIGPETAPLPPTQPNSNANPVSVDAPLVFSAKDHAAAGAPPPVPATTDLPVAGRSAAAVHLDPVIQSPPPEPPADSETKSEGKTEHRGFFHRIGGFFSHIFHRDSG